jgi:hypothetical protein
MRSNPILLLPVIVLLLGGVSLPAHARIKCWTNKDGIRECGTSVPPEYSQKGYTELNEQGMVIDKQERAKTEEELEEAARKAKLEAEKKRKAKEQAKQDRILLYTFSSVDDIKLVRDEQIAAIESNIKVTQKRNEKIQEDLDSRIKAAAAAERAGGKPNEALLKDIETLKRQIKNNEAFIQKRRNEMEQTKQEYSRKIERFKELKGKS